VVAQTITKHLIGLGPAANRREEVGPQSDEKHLHVIRQLVFGSDSIQDVERLRQSPLVSHHHRELHRQVHRVREQLSPHAQHVLGLVAVPDRMKGARHQVAGVRRRPQRPRSRCGGQCAFRASHGEEGLRLPVQELRGEERVVAGKREKTFNLGQHLPVAPLLAPLEAPLERPLDAGSDVNAAVAGRFSHQFHASREERPVPAAPGDGGCRDLAANAPVMPPCPQAHKPCCDSRSESQKQGAALFEPPPVFQGRRVLSALHPFGTLSSSLRYVPPVVRLSYSFAVTLFVVGVSSNPGHN
jgi:hypothetical protein